MDDVMSMEDDRVEGHHRPPEVVSTQGYSLLGFLGRYWRCEVQLIGSMSCCLLGPDILWADTWLITSIPCSVYILSAGNLYSSGPNACHYNASALALNRNKAKTH